MATRGVPRCGSFEVASAPAARHRCIDGGGDCTFQFHPTQARLKSFPLCSHNSKMAKLSIVATPPCSPRYGPSNKIVTPESCDRIKRMEDIAKSDKTAETVASIAPTTSTSSNNITDTTLVGTRFVPVQPTTEDILLKSGAESRQNPGNIRFHEVSSQIRPRFEAMQTRDEKDALGRELASAIAAWGGRFLDYDPTNDTWFEIQERRRHRKCLAELMNSNRKGAELKQTPTNEQDSGRCSYDTIMPGKEPAAAAVSSSQDLKHQIPSGAPETDSMQVSTESINDLLSSRSTSMDRIFQSLSSHAQLFSSSESVNRLLASQSGVSVSLPPLEPLEDNARTLSITMQEPSSTHVGGGEETAMSANTANVPPGTEPTTTMTPRDTVPPAADEATERQNQLIQQLLQSISRAAQSVVMGQNARSTTEETTTTSLSTSTGSGNVLPLTYTALEFFASRGWGTDLGPVQEDVDFEQVFRSREGRPQAAIEQDKKSDMTTTTNTRKRDWNALVMQDLEAGVASTSASTSTSVSQTNKSQTPADMLLLAATAAMREQQEAQAQKETTSSIGTLDTKLAVVSSSSKPPSSQALSAQPQGGATSSTDDDDADYDDDDEDWNKRAQASVSHRKPNSGKRESSKRSSSQPRFVQPNDADVLLGRGGRTNNHPGNKKYLEVKDRMQERYLAADKTAKTPISQELVDTVHEWGGRFLKLDSKENKWFEIDEVTARKKCSQTLREINTPEERAAKRAKYAK